MMYEISLTIKQKRQNISMQTSRSPGRNSNSHSESSAYANTPNGNRPASATRPQGRRFQGVMKKLEMEGNANRSEGYCSSIIDLSKRKRTFFAAIFFILLVFAINTTGLFFGLNHKKRKLSPKQMHLDYHDGDKSFHFSPLSALTSGFGIFGSDEHEDEMLIQQDLENVDEHMKEERLGDHKGDDSYEESDENKDEESLDNDKSLKEALNANSDDNDEKISDEKNDIENQDEDNNDGDQDEEEGNKISVSLSVGVARNGCPFGFVSLPNNESPRCFYMGLEPETHTQAEAECAKFGGHLATILTKNENDLLCTMMSIADNRHARLEMAHIGLKRGEPTKSNSAGEFSAWEDGTPYNNAASKSFWATGEPDGRGYKYSSKESSISKYLKGTYGIIHCRKSGKWIDWSSLKLPYFCSIPKPKQDPSAKKFFDKDGIYGKEVAPPSYWHPTPPLPSNKCSWKPLHHGNVLLSSLPRQYPWETGRRKKGSQRRYYAVWQTKHYFGYQRYWVGYLEDEQTFHPVPVGELWRGSFGSSSANAAQRHTGYFHTPAVLTKYRPRAVFSRLPIPASILVHLDEGALINQLYTVERAPLGDKQLLHLALTEFSKKSGCNLEEAGIYPLSFDMADKKQCLAFVEHVSIKNINSEKDSKEDDEAFEKSMAFEEAAQEELSKLNNADETEEEEEEEGGNGSTKSKSTSNQEENEKEEAESNTLSDSEFTKTAWMVKGSAHGGLAVHVMRASKVVARYGMDCSKPKNETVQRYISNPLLLDDRKFDVRAFMLVASTKPLIVYVYNETYFRGAALKFTDPTSTKNKERHVTNSHIQQKSIMTQSDWENHIWNPSRVARYAEKAGIPSDFASRIMIPRIKTTLQFVMSSIVDSLTDRRPGQWKLFGVDFVVDKNMHPWLIDVNGFPGFGWTFQTPWALGYRKKMLKSMWETIFDVQIGSGNSNPSLKVPRSGGFELIYHGKMPPDEINR